MSEMNVRIALAAVLCLCLSASGAWAQGMVPNRGMFIPCPDPIRVKMTPIPDPLPGGWAPSENPFNVTLDPLNLPRVERNTLICYYRALNQPAAFGIYQGTGGRKCVVSANHKGFDCMP